MTLSIRLSPSHTGRNQYVVTKRATLATTFCYDYLHKIFRWILTYVLVIYSEDKQYEIINLLIIASLLSLDLVTPIVVPLVCKYLNDIIMATN